MRLTKAQLRKIIKEELNEARRRPDSPDITLVKSKLGQRTPPGYGGPPYEPVRPRTPSRTLPGMEDEPAPDEPAPPEEHEMYASDDELREIGTNVASLLEVLEDLANQLGDVGTRYGQLTHVGTYAKVMGTAAQTLSEKYNDALDALSKAKQRGWYK